MHPFRLQPVCKPILWGGTRLAEQFGKIAPESDFGKNVIGETWELVVHGEDVCRVLDGPCAGRPLGEVPGCEDMPILLKYIDAATPLSVQVHPNKTEMWYVVEADPGATLVYGLRDAFDEAVFRQSLAEGKVSDLLHTVEVRKGDVYFIPTGLVHAIGGGILVAEIQQNSTDTYRVYDYNRLHNGKPRELHVDKAMKVIRDYDEAQIRAIRYEKQPPAVEGLTCIAACRYFTVLEGCTGENGLSFDMTALAQGLPSFFGSLMCLEGKGTVNGLPCEKGVTVFLPGDAGKVEVTGDMHLLLILK